MFSSDRDARVRQLYEQLLEIEQRLIPTGLHVFGRASELKEKADLLRMDQQVDAREELHELFSPLATDRVISTRTELVVCDVGHVQRPPAERRRGRRARPE